jgi:hypothetical protein
MTFLSFSEYLPLPDLVKILVVALAVAVVAPSAASIAIVGLDRRESGRTGAGNALIAVGAGVLFVLVAVGIFTLVDR